MKRLLTLILPAVVLTAGAPPAGDAQEADAAGPKVWGLMGISPTVISSSNRAYGQAFTLIGIGFGIDQDSAKAQVENDCDGQARKLYARGSSRSVLPSGQYNILRKCGIVAKKSTAKSCIAAAFAGDPGGTWAAGWGFADNYNEASAEAISDCQRKGVSGCQVAKAACPG